MTVFSWSRFVGGLLPSQVSNLSRDLKVMSRPLLMSIYFLLVATSILCCNQFSPFNLYYKSRPQGDVATMCYYCSVVCSPNCSNVVTTWMSGRDIVCGLCLINGRNLSFLARTSFGFASGCDLPFVIQLLI